MVLRLFTRMFHTAGAGGEKRRGALVSYRGRKGKGTAWVFLCDDFRKREEGPPQLLSRMGKEGVKESDWIWLHARKVERDELA